MECQLTLLLILRFIHIRKNVPMFSKHRFAARDKDVVFVGCGTVPVHLEFNATLLDGWNAVETPECVASEGKARLLLDVEWLTEVLCLLCLLKAARKIRASKLAWWISAVSLLSVSKLVSLAIERRTGRPRPVMPVGLLVPVASAVVAATRALRAVAVAMLLVPRVLARSVLIALFSVVLIVRGVLFVC